MNIRHLFTKSFLFQPEYVGVQRADKVIVILGLVAIFVAIAFKVASIYSGTPALKKYTVKFYHLFLTMGISTALWYACVYEHLRFLSWRAIPGLLFIWGVVWFVRIVVHMARNYSSEKETYEKEQLKLKYLPK
jgi:hypothetical protein